jgi:hypothetical protein
MDHPRPALQIGALSGMAPFGIFNVEKRPDATYQYGTNP